MFKFFKNLVNKKPSWERDWNKFIEKCNEEQLYKYCETLPTKDRLVIDYTKGIWGHSIVQTSSIRNDRLIWEIIGFYSGSQIIKNRNLQKGDFIYMKSKSGVGKYLILKHEQIKDPRDMFIAFIVCIDVKNSIEDYNKSK